MTKANTSIRKAIHGFGKHVELERLVRQEIAGLEELRKLEYDIGARSRKKKDDVPRFIENIGAVSIYSIAQAEELYSKAEENYSEDRSRYARSLLNEISKAGNRRNLAGPPSDESIEELHRDFPNFAEAIEHIEHATALSRLSDRPWFQMRPMLLLGPAGVGKTAFAQAFASSVGVKFKRFDVGAMSTASAIAGLSMAWSTGHAGEMLRLITTSETANPICMLDEVDKMSGHEMAPLEPTILALLEQESACSFRDEGLLLRINLGYINWLATANDLDVMSAPLKSRFSIVTVSAPSRDQAPAVIRSIYNKIRNANPWGKKFPHHLDDNVIDRLVGYSPRELNHILMTAFGRAAIRGANQIEPRDVPVRVNQESVRIGFM
jgi:ATP-dependent Lon protease